MDETKFWSLIAESREAVEGSPDELQDMLDELEQRLEELPLEEIAAFHHIMRRMFWKAYTYGLSAALYIITDEDCDDQDFLAFRGWLIAQGQQTFEQAVADADSLADTGIIPRDIFLPGILSIGEYVYREATGEEPPPDEDFTPPKQMHGDPLTIDDLPTRLPKLCDEFLFEVEVEAEADEE